MSPEADNEEFQICKLLPLGFRLELEALTYKLGSSKDLADLSEAVTSLKGDTSGLMIRPSLSIADVKQKIRDELAFSASRLLLNDKPLQDTLLVREANLTAGLCVGAAKGKQNLKKRRVNHKAGPRERRRIKAKQAEEQLNQSLNLMTEADRLLFMEQMAGDEETVKGFDESGSLEPVAASLKPVIGSSEPARCAEEA